MVSLAARQAPTLSSAGSPDCNSAHIHQGGATTPQKRNDRAVGNLGTELAGAVAIYVLLDIFLGTRQRKQRLIAKMSSGVRDVALEAADELERELWLFDGSMRGAALVRADLEGVSLPDADLRGATLAFSDFSDAKLMLVDLRNALLRGTDLSGAFLGAANLEGANLDEANLKNAMMFGANLLNANLENANLEGAILEALDYPEGELGYGHRLMLLPAHVSPNQLAQAQSLAGATLPDGTKLSEDNWRAEFEEWRRKQEKQRGDE